MLYQERGIQVNYGRVLQSIDPGRRLATFKTAGAARSNPMTSSTSSRPCARRGRAEQPLPWTADKNKAWAAEGWLEVDKGTLRHLRYANVFGVGDIAGVPKGRTAASVKWRVPVALDHLVAEIAGKTSECPCTPATPPAR